jgi:hypothetical protein
VFVVRRAPRGACTTRTDTVCIAPHFAVCSGKRCCAQPPQLDSSELQPDSTRAGNIFDMSFGFSVGDFIAVGKLIKDISLCLQDMGGAKADYQELVRELECLQQALKHLDRLDHGRASPLSLQLDSIKYAALSCRRPLEQFLAKLRKHDKPLGIWSKAGALASTSHKLQWSFGHKEEVQKLQGYLNIHVGTINILLAEHGLEKMDIASDKAAKDQLHIRERLEDTRSIVKSISGRMNAQALAVGATQNMTTRLCEMISGEFRTSWRTLGQMVAKVLYVYVLICQRDIH